MMEMLNIKIVGNTIKLPNPNYQALQEEKFHKFRTMSYPDLAIQGNLKFNVVNNVSGESQD